MPCWAGARRTSALRPGPAFLVFWACSWAAATAKHGCRLPGHAQAQLSNKAGWYLHAVHVLNQDQGCACTHTNILFTRI